MSISERVSEALIWFETGGEVTFPGRKPGIGAIQGNIDAHSAGARASFFEDQVEEETHAFASVEQAERHLVQYRTRLNTKTVELASLISKFTAGNKTQQDVSKGKIEVLQETEIPATQKAIDAALRYLALNRPPLAAKPLDPAETLQANIRSLKGQITRTLEREGREYNPRLSKELQMHLQVQITELAALQKK